MEVKRSDLAGGSLQISTDVIAKIAKLAALEQEGIAQVSCGGDAVKGALAKVSIQKPVEVEMKEDVAQSTVHIVVKYGYKVPVVCEAIQKNVKSAVQSMTGITVSKVNMVVEGVQLDTQKQKAE